MQQTKKPEAYAVSQIMDAVVLSRSIDKKGRPYIHAGLLEPNSSAFCMDEKPAEFIRVYCSPSMDVKEQFAFIDRYDIGRKFPVIPKQPAHSIRSTCLGDFADYFQHSSLDRDIKLPEATVKQATFTVKCLQRDLVEAVDARIKSEDLTRTFVIKKLLNGFVAGKYDDDIF